MTRNKTILLLDTGLSLLVLAIMAVVARNPYSFSTCAGGSDYLTPTVTAASLALLPAIALCIWAHHTGQMAKLHYLAKICLRYTLAYILVFYALAFTEGKYWSSSLTLQDMRIADLNAAQYVRVFMGYSKALPALLAGFMMLSAGLLAFRRTSSMGLVTTLGLWSTLFTIDMTFGLCSVPVSTSVVLLSVYLLAPSLPRVISASMGYAVPSSVTWPILSRQQHIYRSLGILKLAVIIGLMANLATNIWMSQKYYRSNQNSPIVGVWDVVDIQYQSDTGELSTDTIPLELASFKSLFLDESRYGAVKIDEDTLSTFEYIVDSNYNQLEFWNFFEFKDLDLKGKYHMSDSDTLIYDATNRKESLRMVLKRNPRYRVD